MINDRERKASEKEIDRMLKVMPYFNGDSNDNFESRVLSARKTLSYGKHCTEEQKLDVILTKVRGNAFETSENCGILNTVDLVFSALKSQLIFLVPENVVFSKLKCRLWYEKSLKIFLLIQRGAETALQLILTQLQIEQMLLLLLLLLLMQLLLLL